MKNIWVLILLLTLNSPLLWANTHSAINEENLEATYPRSWVIALAPIPYINIFVSKDFFPASSGLGFSTTSRINYGNDQGFILENDTRHNLKFLSLEQTGNLDLKFGWFHFQIQLGPNYSISVVEKNGSNYLKGAIGFAGGTNFIISDRVVLSLQLREVQISNNISFGTGAIYLGWRF